MLVQVHSPTGDLPCSWPMQNGPCNACKKKIVKTGPPFNTYNPQLQVSIYNFKIVLLVVSTKSSKGFLSLSLKPFNSPPSFMGAQGKSYTLTYKAKEVQSISYQGLSLIETEYGIVVLLLCAGCLVYLFFFFLSINFIFEIIL